jgi:mannitol/fructose-specific phosphotransferase system IIA component (Ntr-type)
MLLSPPGDPEGHLETLADIARMMGNEETRSRMLSAADADGLLDAIRDSGH